MSSIEGRGFPNCVRLSTRRFSRSARIFFYAICAWFLTIFPKYHHNIKNTIKKLVENTTWQFYLGEGVCQKCTSFLRGSVKSVPLMTKGGGGQKSWIIDDVFYEQPLYERLNLKIYIRPLIFSITNMECSNDSWILDADAMIFFL